MAKKSIPKRLDREQLELNTLRLLRSAFVGPGTRMEICRLFHSEDFLDPFRKTIFEAIQAAGPVPPKRLHTALKAHLRNHGFRPFDLDKLLAPELASEGEIEGLFESALCLLKLDGANTPVLFASEANAQD